MSKSFIRLWRAERLVAGAVLIATAVFQPALVMAQSTPTSPPPATAGQPADPDRYPREDALVQINGSGQTRSVQPIKTTRTPRGHEVVADRLVVRFHDDLSDADLAEVLQKAARLGAGTARSVGKVGRAHLVDVSGATSLEDAARAFVAADPGVRSAGPDHVMRGSATPNDTDFAKQWDMNIIKAPQAWNRTLGSAQTRIAILDSGISSHPDLAGKVVASKDFIAFASGASDQWGHGTNVAGIAAATTNNALGVAGVGYNATLLNGKVIDDTGSGSVFGLADGIYWAVENGATVINMSLHGGSSCDPNPIEDLFDTGVNELRDALAYAWSQNVVLVAAASNDGNTTRHWPGACPNVIAVANTDENDKRVSSSSYGTWVDVAAPGSAIWSPASPNGVKCVNGRIGDYAICGGTSSAAPHVAGLAALVQKSCAPITAQGVVDRITSTADQIDGTGTLWQFGRINAARAVCFPKPANLHVVEQKTTSIRVGWTDMTPGRMSFEVQYRPSGTTTWKSESAAATDTVAFIDGLTPGTSYDFRVQECESPVDCSGFTNQITAKALDLYKLTVSVGSGAGKVTSTPAGISCGNGSADCTESYAPGTLVKLTAVPVLGYLFDHWEGSCTGKSAACSVTLSAARTAKAFFVKAPSEPAPPPCPPTLPNCQEQ
jgi:thermitase